MKFGTEQEKVIAGVQVAREVPVRVGTGIAFQLVAAADFAACVPCGGCRVFLAQKSIYKVNGGRLDRWVAAVETASAAHTLALPKEKLNRTTANLVSAVWRFMVFAQSNDASRRGATGPAATRKDKAAANGMAYPAISRARAFRLIASMSCATGKRSVPGYTTNRASGFTSIQAL